MMQTDMKKKLLNPPIESLGIKNNMDKKEVLCSCDATLPKSIKIGYRDYKLEEWKQTVATANEASGQLFIKEGVIGYNQEEKGVSHANTILHEIIHGIVYQWNMELDERREESIVNSLTNGLTTVFVDNPQLLDYLRLKIKEG